MFDTHPDQRMAADALRAVAGTHNTLMIADAIGAVVFLMPGEETSGVLKPLIDVWIKILSGKPFTSRDAEKVRGTLQELELYMRITAKK